MAKTYSKQNRRSYKARQSKLFPVTGDLMRMHREERSLADMKFYIRHVSEHRITAGRTTIKSYIDKLNRQAKERDESLF